MHLELQVWGVVCKPVRVNWREIPWVFPPSRYPPAHVVSQQTSSGNGFPLPLPLPLRLQVQRANQAE
jgi:hypothetical protein